ncbi:hypothetical protein [Pedococcus aerophilus]|uniref:hypothetical protein n=1 Tax=Pedococcus aerophilus TaxID=436356 RepID=UPI0031E13B62
MTTTRTTTVLTATAGLLGLGLLGACGSTDTTSASGTTSTTPTSSTTSSTESTSTSPDPTTVTVTTTASPSSTTRKPQVDSSPTTPPPGKDAPAIPRSAQDYGTAFVAAWVEGDRTRATQLGTEAAVKAAFASTVDTMPRFVRCEGAAGSSYCTWEGNEYTLQVRLRNEMASLGQPHAVTEVVFQH